MIKVEAQLEYISFFKDEVKLKFLFINAATRQRVVHFVYDYKNAADYLKLVETYNEFLKSHNLEVATPDTNVVLSTNDVFNTTLILPKAAKSKLHRFIENDLLDKFGPDYKNKYRTTSIVSKYKDDGVAVVTSIVSNDLIHQIRDVLVQLKLRIKNITTINFLLHEKRSLQKNEYNKIVLYVRDSYTAINVYYKGALIERSASYHSYNYITSLNIVQRRKLIRELVLSVVALVGKSDFMDKDIEFENVDLYVNDDVLANQFRYENPLKFEYNVIKNDDFNTNIFKKYNFNKTPTLGKGFTLVEVTVSLAIFSICAAGLLTSAAVLANTSSDDNLRSDAFMAVQSLVEDVQNNPLGAISYLDDYAETDGIRLLSFDNKFNRIEANDTTTTPFANVVYTVTHDQPSDSRVGSVTLNIDNMYRVDNNKTLVRSMVAYGVYTA